MWVVHGYLAGLDPGRWEELLAACSLFTERVERGEGPEFFLDLTRLPEPEGAVRELGRLLVPGLGENFLASLAGNKLVARAATLAQMAGLVRGENGVVVVPPGKEADFLAPLPLAYLWPVNPRLLERLRLLGLRTIGQVAELPVEELYRFFGSEGFRVAELSRGRDGSRVKGTLPAYLEYRTLWAGEADRERLRSWCAAAAAYLAREEERRRVWGRRLELILCLENTEAEGHPLHGALRTALEERRQVSACKPTGAHLIRIPLPYQSGSAVASGAEPDPNPRTQASEGKRGRCLRPEGPSSARAPSEPSSFVLRSFAPQGDARGAKFSSSGGAAGGMGVFPENGPPFIYKREFNRPHLTAADLHTALERLLPAAFSGRLSAVAARLGPLEPLLCAQLSLPVVRPRRERERLEKVLARLEERYPGRISWGSRWPASRRERVLAFFDPLRRREKSEGEKNHAAG